MKIIRFTLRLLLILLNLVAGLLIAALVFHGGNREYHHHKSIIRRWLKLCALIMGCKVEMIHPADESSDVRGSLFVANHISWLDIFVFGGWFTVRQLSKSEVRSWPFFGWLSAASGTLFIERGRGAQDSISEIHKALVNMDNVMVFPESTTSSGISVKPFHPRLLKAAAEAQRPVTPVMISYRDNNQPLTDIALNEENHIGVTMWRVLSRPCTQVIIQQFSPIWPEQHSSRTDLAKKCNRLISAGLATLYTQ
ncbi:MAG: lysophospholipid acyltransferase family protein [Chromatiales bacterium]